MNNHLASYWRRQTAQRRSIKRTFSLDVREAEGRYRTEPSTTLTPERAFERQWALTLLETVVNRLHREYDEAGNGAQFLALRFAITADSKTLPYAELANKLELSEEGARVAAHRLRQRYRKLLRDEIGQTVADPAEIADELRDLYRILSS